MKKVLLTAVALATMSSGSYADPYTTSGSAQGIITDATITPTTTYTAPNANPTISGDWDITVNGNTADFSGTLYLGDFTLHTVVRHAFLGSMSGDNSVVGAQHLLSGTGSWDADTHTLTYNYLGSSNDGSGSLYSETSYSCTDSGSMFGNTICGSGDDASPNWEGLELKLVFDAGLNTFSGTLTGISTSGSGLTANTTKSIYAINGVSAVPEQAAGSGLES